MIITWRWVLFRGRTLFLWESKLSTYVTFGVGFPEKTQGTLIGRELEPRDTSLGTSSTRGGTSFCKSVEWLRKKRREHDKLLMKEAKSLIFRLVQTDNSKK